MFASQGRARGAATVAGRLRLLVVLPALAGLALSGSATADDALHHGQKLLAGGEYETCLRLATGRAAGDLEWAILTAQGELALGRLDAAEKTVAAALRLHPDCVRLRLLAHRLAAMSGDHRGAAEQLDAVHRRAGRAPWRSMSAAETVALAEVLLLCGAPPDEVLREYVERARVDDPDCREAWRMSGALMLEQQGPERAAEILGQGLERFPNDPDLHFALARALLSIDPAAGRTHLDDALRHNPRHVPALIVSADLCIAADELDEATSLLDRALAVNPRDGEALAFRAVVAHLTGDPERAEDLRRAALADCPSNPTIDHLIGLKLSQKYRFALGIEHQRRALEIDPRFVPARLQLSQDLLKLGRNEEAWAAADDVVAGPAGQTAAKELGEVRDALAALRTLEDEHFLVRMEAHEAEVYGDRVLALLNRARETLCPRYGVELTEKVVVEIYPAESAFAVRSFGSRAAAGQPAVCFGRVITMCSPAAVTERHATWEAILWHEFAHVVTLHATRHQMPRWLSEGLSVYEEQRENPAWGQRMNPMFRERILGGDVLPMARMGEVFAFPRDAADGQFGYYQSELFVEFFVERYGFETLTAVLRDLGAGLSLDESLRRHAAEPSQLDVEFAEFARRRAEAFAPEADWERPHPDAVCAEGPRALERWLEDHPRSVAALDALARQRLRAGDWEAAQEPLWELVDLCPDYVGPESPYLRLAEACRELDDAGTEQLVLGMYAAQDVAAAEPLLRLAELQTASRSWRAALRTTDLLLAINPMDERIYRIRGQAAEKLDHFDAATRAWQTLLCFDPPDAEWIHRRLAVLHHDAGNSEAAERHVEQASHAAARLRTASLEAESELSDRQ